VLDADQRKAAEKDLSLHARNFADGDHVIREGARLTEIGAQAITAARDYMAS
jgi:hypothetical protein